MSIFASQTQTTIPVPFDAPHTVTIRKLTGREVEQAQAEDARAMATGGARTWAARLKRMAQTGDAAAMTALTDPLIGYDRFSIIRSGLVSWSYPESIAVIPARPGKAAVAATAIAAVDPMPAKDAIGDLDDEAADFIATEILRLTKPGLFVTTGDEAKAAQKND